jgi:hypothetical protein
MDGPSNPIKPLRITSGPLTSPSDLILFNNLGQLRLVSHNTSIWILHWISGLSLVYPLFVHDSTMKERPEEWMSNLTTAIPPDLMEISRAAPGVCACLSRPI